MTNLRYADDTTLLAGTKEDLVELVGRVRRASEKAGLYLNVGKTKVMTTGGIGEVTVQWPIQGGAQGARAPLRKREKI